MSADPVRKLHAFLKKLPPSTEDRSVVRSRSDRADPVLQELVLSFLAWEVGLTAAKRSLSQIDDATADYNELRVCLPHELARMVTVHDDRFEERSLRLRSVLNDIYRREHELSLSHLLQLPKRDARAYMDSLDGMPPYVSSRVCLLTLGAHAVPVDSRIVQALRGEGCIPAELDASPHSECASWLEHHIRAEDSHAFYVSLEASLDASYQSVGGKPAPAKRKANAPKPKVSAKREAPAPKSRKRSKT
ncbi:MAG: hypothetical protein KF912_03200 [Phycisphaeraceae bacterium]|nr:hypothetical protein [Phycisphaeraceae bacterium]MBX3366306.1 hypothetical protein [Phycisphaeraceae bacterium]